MAKQQTPPDDSDLDACESELMNLKGRLAPTVGAAPGAPVGAIDPAMIMTIVEVLLKMIDRWRNRP